jgi:hypothetical protein
MWVWGCCSIGRLGSSQPLPGGSESCLGGGARVSPSGPGRSGGGGPRGAAARASSCARPAARRAVPPPRRRRAARRAPPRRAAPRRALPRRSTASAGPPPPPRAGARAGAGGPMRNHEYAICQGRAHGRAPAPADPACCGRGHAPTRPGARARACRAPGGPCARRRAPVTLGRPGPRDRRYLSGGGWVGGGWGGGKPLGPPGTPDGRRGFLRTTRAPAPPPPPRHTPARLPAPACSALRPPRRPGRAARPGRAGPWSSRGRPASGPPAIQFIAQRAWPSRGRARRGPPLRGPRGPLG